MAVGGLVLVAWVLDLADVKRLVPGLPEMKANTALGLIALGIVVLLLREGHGAARARLGRTLASVVAVFGAVVLAEYAFGPVGIDEWLFDDEGPAPGRSAPHTAVAFVLLGAALATLDGGPRARRGSAVLLGAAAMVVLSALVGYIYDVDFLRASSRTTGVAIHTAMTLAVITVGAAALRPDRGLVGYLRGDDVGAITARRLLPAVVLVPLVLGVIRLQTDKLGVDEPTGVGLTALASMAVFLTLVLLVASRLTRTDVGRLRAEARNREALSRFRSLLDATPDPTVVVDARGRMKHVNRRTEEAFGYEPGELVGQPVETLLPERYRHAHHGHRAAFAANPAPRAMGTGRELFARRKDGREVPVEISLSPVSGDDDALVIAAIRDVTERRTTEARLREAARFFDMSHDLLCTISLDGRFLQINGAWEPTLGWTADELRSRPFMARVHPDDLEAAVEQAEGLRTGATAVVEFVLRYATKGGGWRWLEWHATAVRDEQLVYASARDITARVEAEDARRQAEVRFTQAFEKAPIGMGLTGLDGRYISVNPAFCELTGYSADQLCATSVHSITHPDDVDDDVEARRAMMAGELIGHRSEKRYVGSDGEVIPVDVSVTLVRDRHGEPSHFVSQVVDMSERKRFEGQLQYLADHDPLTGLFNRRRFEEELSRELAVAARYGESGALLALDLDHFKYINDSLGHAVGDQLITQVGATMKHRLRDTDVLARLGGDEFAIVLPRADREQALAVAGQLLAGIRDEGQLAEGRRVTASIGITTFDRAAELTADELMVEADIAMYDAKEAGRDRAAVFDAAGGRQERMQARLTWADRIHDALDNGRFLLEAQPILGLDDDRVPRYELLIRMLGDDGDLIPPGTFLYIAERFEMVQRIDRWVIGEAIRLLAEQERMGREIRLEVNLSAKSMTDLTLPDAIAEQLAASGADPRGLCFEITETAAIVNVDQARHFAHRLQDLGCTFALDDFGAGFASFYYLKHLDFDFLKIDGEFIRDLAESRTNQLVVQSLVQIAKGLGKRTIAEFVGDEQTLQLVRQFGVDYAQGFHIAKPGPIARSGRDGRAVFPELGRHIDSGPCGEVPLRP